MAVSKVDICNKALTFLGLGSKPITSLDENSANARTLKNSYPSVRDAVLRSHNWGFARRIETLARISGESVPGWTYLYASPSLSLATRKVFDNIQVTNPDSVEFQEVLTPTSSQKGIVCNSNPAYIEYTYQIDDPSIYSADFITAFAMALAAETAYTITGNTDLGPKLQVSFSGATSEAKRTNASGKNVDPTADQSASSYEDSR